MTFKQRTSNSVPSTGIKNVTSTEPEDIANVFNKYFIHISSTKLISIVMLSSESSSFLHELNLSPITLNL